MDFARATALLDRDGDATTWPRLLLAENRDAFVVGIGALARTDLPEESTPAAVLDAGRALSASHGFVMGAVRFDRFRAREDTPQTAATGFEPFGPGFFFAPRAVVRRAHDGGVTGADDVERLFAASRELVRAHTRPPAHVENEVERSRFDRVGALALESIARGSLEKVVLARRITVHVPFSLGQIARALDDDDHGLTYVFSPEPGLAFIGRTPETLLSGRDGTYTTEAVAGTVRREADSGLDAHARAALIGSAKDAREHALVVEHVAHTCARMAARAAQKPRTLRSLSRVHHLVTPFTVACAPDAVVALAAALHPTPALAGTPVADARGFIAREEGFDRGLYGGLIGWLDGAALDLRVAIRGALVEEGQATILVGAGFVDGSVVERELEETNGKARALTDAFERVGARHA